MNSVYIGALKRLAEILSTALSEMATVADRLEKTALKEELQSARALVKKEGVKAALPKGEMPVALKAARGESEGHKEGRRWRKRRAHRAAKSAAVVVKPTPTKDMLTPSQAADFLDLSAPNLYHHIAAKKFRGVERTGRYMLIPRASLEDFKKRRAAKAVKNGHHLRA